MCSSDLTPRPPTAHTHRGKPRPFVLDGHHAATKPAHTPTHRKPGTITAQAIFEHRARLAARTTPNTHRGEPRSVMEELRFNNTNAGRTHE